VPDEMSIILSNELSNVAAQTTLDLQGLIASMRTSGMSDSAIKATLMSDLTSGGRLFGNYRNGVKNTVKSGIGRAGNIASEGRFFSAGVNEFQWVTASSKPCPDCERRHGETGTMEYWRTAGKPRSGFSVCQSSCQCQLLPVGYNGENLDKPLVRGRRVQWKPSMPLKSAEEWGKSSQFKDTVLHTTNKSNIGSLQNTGFDLNRSGMGRFFGDGVYTSTNSVTNKWYVDKFGANASTLKMKIKVRNTMRVDLSDVRPGLGWHDKFLDKIDDSVSGFKSKYRDNLRKRWKYDNTLFENAPHHTDELWDVLDANIDQHLTKKQILERNKYFDRTGFISNAELQESRVLTETLKDFGFDSLHIIDDGVREFIGGEQMIVFNTKNVVIYD